MDPLSATLIRQAGKILREAIDAIAEAYDVFTRIADQQTQRRAAKELLDSTRRMPLTNANKLLIIEKIKAFAAAPTEAKWEDIRGELRNTNVSLGGLIEDLKTKTTVLVQTAGLQLASDLMTCLRRQQDAFDELSRITAISADAASEIDTIVTTLETLTTRVVALEARLDKAGRSK